MIPYQKHSETSKAAAKAYDSKSLENLVMKHIYANGEYGATNNEILMYVRRDRIDPSPGTIAARLKGLQDKGYIIKTRRTRNSARTGRAQSVYVDAKHCDEPILTKEPTKSQKCVAFCEWLRGKIERKGRVELWAGSDNYLELKKILK